MQDKTSESPCHQCLGQRRNFIATASGIAMSAGVAGGYGTLGYMLGSFVYPSGESNRGWMFVCTVERLKPGDSLDYIGPSGAKIVVARQKPGPTAEDFLALSSVCPHLGCQVHWEAQEQRFFCPCHNGAFDSQGMPLSGPPKAANQSLVRFPLKVEEGLLYVLVPLESVVTPTDANAHQSGVA